MDADGNPVTEEEDDMDEDGDGEDEVDEELTTLLIVVGKGDEEGTPVPLANPDTILFEA